MNTLKIKKLWNKSEIRVEFSDDGIFIDTPLDDFKDEYIKRLAESIPDYGLNLSSKAIRADIKVKALQILNQLIREIKETTR